MDGLIMAVYVAALLFSKNEGSLSLIVGLIMTITANAISKLSSVHDNYLLFHSLMLLLCFSWVSMLRLVHDAVIRLPVIGMMFSSSISFICGLIYGDQITFVFIAYPYLTIALHLLYICRAVRLRGDHVVVSCWTDVIRMLSRIIHMHKAG